MLRRLERQARAGTSIGVLGHADFDQGAVDCSRPR